MIEIKDAVRETMTLGQALIVGVFMGVYYDVFRVIRRIFRFGYSAVIAQDIFFWLTSAVVVFFACIWFSGGIVRIYFIAAVLMGWGAYTATVGALLMFFIDKIISFVKKISSIINKKVIVPTMKQLKMQRIRLNKYISIKKEKIKFQKQEKKNKKRLQTP